MISGIYGILHRPSGRWYVGRSINIRNRWRAHKRHTKAGSMLPLHQALRNHESNEFTWMVLQPCGAIEALSLEELWIAKLRAFGVGFNCTEGGDTTPGIYEATKQKMIAAGKARKDRPFLGKKHTVETIALLKVAASQRGQEWRDKISAKAKGRRLTPEHRARLCIAHQGLHQREANPFFGKRHSEQARKAMSAALLGKRRLKQEKIAEILALRTKGTRLDAISKAVRVSTGTASRVIREHYGPLPKGAAARVWLNERLARHLKRAA